MELFNIVQEVHYSYGTLACMVHVLKMGYRGRSHDRGMTGHMINKCSLITTESVYQSVSQGSRFPDFLYTGSPTPNCDVTATG